MPVETAEPTASAEPVASGASTAAETEGLRSDRPNASEPAGLTMTNVARLPAGPLTWRPDNSLPEGGGSPDSLDSIGSLQYYESMTRCAGAHTTCA